MNHQVYRVHPVHAPCVENKIAWLSAHHELWGAIAEPYQGDLCQMMADCQAAATNFRGALDTDTDSNGTRWVATSGSHQGQATWQHAF